MTMKKDTNGLFKSFLEKDERLMDNPFSVPEGYFDELESRTLTLSRMAEWKENEGFEVPEGYFEDLNDRILAAVAAEPLIRTLPARSEEAEEAGSGEQSKSRIRRLVRSVGLRYATAAVILIFSVFLIKDRLTENQSPLADISDQELIQYLQFYGGTGDALVISENLYINGDQSHTWSGAGSGLSAEDIEWYLDNTW